jgi:hypothetical protein
VTNDALEKLTSLSHSTRRLLEYVAVLPDGARYSVLRHIIRISEEDMVIELQEAVGAGVLEARVGQPDIYDFASDEIRQIVMEGIGPARMPKLQARAQAARRRVEGPDDYGPSP